MRLHRISIMQLLPDGSSRLETIAKSWLEANALLAGYLHTAQLFDKEGYQLEYCVTWVDGTSITGDIMLAADTPIDMQAIVKQAVLNLVFTGKMTHGYAKELLTEYFN